jgi:hypothetical protein
VNAELRIRFLSGEVADGQSDEPSRGDPGLKEERTANYCLLYDGELL